MKRRAVVLGSSLDVDPDIPKKSSVHRLVYESGQVDDDFWATKNNGRLCCWHDTEPFDGYVYSYPVRKEGATWVVRGAFCGLSCAKRSMIDTCFGDTNIFTLFSSMCAQVYGITETIYAAPQRELLRKFCLDPGQGISLEQMRAIGSDKHRLDIVHPPIYPFKLSSGYVCENRSPDDESTHSMQYMRVDGISFPSRKIAGLKSICTTPSMT